MKHLTPIEEYEGIDDIVFRFQNGDAKAAEELIKAFEPYLKKYNKLIKEGLLNFSDKDSRRFVGLFIDDVECRKKLKLSQHPADVKSQASAATSLIVYLCSDIPYEDMWQELVVLLLILAKRYKKKRQKVNFCGYLYNVYKYELYRKVLEITSDPLVHRADINFSYDDETYMNDEEMILDEPSIYTSETLMITDEDLGNSWVRGITCSEMFDELEPIERLILKLKYDNCLTDIEIARRMGIHRNTVRAQRLKAIDKIKYTLGDNGENY